MHKCSELKSFIFGVLISSAHKAGPQHSELKEGHMQLRGNEHRNGHRNGRIHIHAYCK